MKTTFKCLAAALIALRSLVHAAPISGSDSALERRQGPSVGTLVTGIEGDVNSLAGHVLGMSGGALKSTANLLSNLGDDGRTISKAFP
ncbi:hypothetical protein BDQ17DRAFT_1429268 [Cyathus striatus]|nr:hypothetical protein BDQ17DRAFT_1429268 [Cyathus striatus]